MLTSPEMSATAQAAAVVAALLHVVFFYVESIAFGRPEVYQRFGVKTEQDARAVRPMALNQGFYNLFLGVGIVVGLWLVSTGNVAAGRALVLFACASMVGAAVVLISTNARFARAALVQGIPPLVALLATIF